MNLIPCYFCNHKLADRRGDKVRIHGIELEIPKGKRLKMKCPECGHVTKACRRSEKEMAIIPSEKVLSSKNGGVPE